MSQSTHKVEVVRIVQIEKHPNADKMGIVRIWGFVCCVQLGQFKEGDLAAFVFPDSVLPDRPEYAFLDGHLRIKVRKLRGIISQGLLLPAPEGAREGDDVAQVLGITHYDPPLPMSPGDEFEKGPLGVDAPDYDLEDYRRYPSLLAPFEEVMLTEKMDGGSAAYVFTENRMWAKGKSQWRKKSATNLYWQTLDQNPWIETFCRLNPGLVIYGEVYGWVQKLRYGAVVGQVKFAVFDILRNGKWLDAIEARQVGHTLQWVNIVTVGPWSKEMLAMADGQTTVAGAEHLREGIVVKPIKERTHQTIGRVALKIVSDKHLMED